MKNDSQIQIRIDAKTKREAQRILEDIGLDASSAVKVLFRQIVKTGGFPMELRTDNGFTLKEERNLIKETKEALRVGKRYLSVKKMHRDILK